MSRRLRRIFAALIIFGLAVPITVFVTREKPVSVIVKSVEKGKVEATVANTRSGTVKACKRAKLAPPTGGQIAHLDVREGDHVEAGELLLELWNEDLAAEKRLAESEAQAKLAHAEEACSLAEEAERDARRKSALRKRELIAEAAYDQAVTTAKARRAACEAARANAEMSRAQIAVRQALLDRTILTAPFAGTVAEVNGEEGEFVTPSPTGIATLPAVDLVDTSCLYVSAPIDEMDAPALEKGMEARITLDAFPHKNFKGRVSRIAPYVLELKKQARTVEVEAVFSDPLETKSLLPGYSADLEIILDVRDNVLRIPTESIVEGNRVLVFRGETGKIEQRHIEPGLSNWRFTEVISGLKEGELVITSLDREGVKPGARAEPEFAPAGTGER